MKLSSKVLAGSLASAGMVLSLVAPALTAQAATTSGTFENGKLTPTTDLDKGVAASNLANDDHTISNPDVLAIAYDNGTGTTGKATANSNVNVKVVSGLLTLDAVPDFGFGSGASGSTVSLKDNNATGEAVDGNNTGVLQVTDSRATQPSGSGDTAVAGGDTTGFQLTATLGAFSTADAPQPSDASLLNKFDLTLNPQEVLDGAGESASTNAASKLETTSAKLTSDGTTSAEVLSPAAGSYKVGTLKTSFTGENKGATLAIPNGLTKNDATAPSIQSYKSVMTWTLNAAAKAQA